MRSILVGFVGAVALTGCGVGMDDPEGELAATGSASTALMAASVENTASAQAEFRNPTGQDPRTMLPQDPIPVLVGDSVRGGGGGAGK